MKRYEIVVAGEVITRAETREEAEKLLEEAKNSFLRMVHPIDCFWIREKE